MSKQIMIIAGEASGDMHAGALIRQVLTKAPDTKFYGIGGEQMRALGTETLVNASELAVVGLFEVIAHRKVIFSALHNMQALLKTRRPDLLVLVDYAEFNLKLAKTAKDLGVKVLFYISPQVWAWRQKRVHKIKQRVDMMAVIFPFEATFYKKYNVPVEYVGHPLIGKVTANISKEDFCLEHDLDSKQPLVGIFPGSRRSEIKRLLPILLESANRIRQHNADVKFVLPVASTIDDSLIRSYLQDAHLPITLVNDRTYDVINACDTIMTVSGTVTLEIALMKTPFVIINRLSWLSYILVKRMIKITYIGLCNIVTNKEVAKEFIQGQATAKNISTEIIHLLKDAAYYQRKQTELEEVEEKLTETQSSKNIGDVVLEMLEG